MEHDRGAPYQPQTQGKIERCIKRSRTEERAIAASERGAPTNLAPEHDQLLPQRPILGFKPVLRLEECDQQAYGQ